MKRKVVFHRSLPNPIINAVLIIIIVLFENQYLLAINTVCILWSIRKHGSHVNVNKLYSSTRVQSR